MKHLTIVKTAAIVVISFFILLSMGCDSGSSGTGNHADNAPGMAMSEVMGPETIDDNVVVLPNTITTFKGTTVKGDVTVMKNAQFFANGASIYGNVQAYGAYLVDLDQQTFIDGDVQGDKARSVIVRGGTVVGGNVQITKAVAPADVDALLVNNAEVGGDVQAEESSGRLRVKSSLVFGNLQFEKNETGPYEVTGNVIDGDLQFFKNQGAGTITGNQVGGNLQSKENNPQPTIFGNIVEGDLEIESGGNGDSSIDDGTDDSIDDGTDDSTDDGTDDGTDDSTDDGTDDSTDDSTDDGTDDSTDDGTDDSTDDGTDDSTDDNLSEVKGTETIDDNFTVMENTITTFNGTTVKGNVIVMKNARFFANGASIEGNVQAYGAYLVDLGQQTFIDGDVQGEKTRLIIVHGGTVVGGNVRITEAVVPEDVDALLVNNAEVGGDVQAKKSSGHLRVTNSLVFGNLQFEENKTGPYEVAGNVIDGDLQFFKNQGAGTITGNQVGSNLQSKENNPQPTIFGNIVEGDLGIESGGNGGSSSDYGTDYGTDATGDDSEGDSSVGSKGSNSDGGGLRMECFIKALKN